MTSISLPPSQSSTFTHLETPHDSFYQHSHLKLSAAAPEPNPPFSFPAAPPPASHRPSASTSALKPESASSPPPLPEFSFNPGASQPANAKPAVVPPRPGGHRRRGSEYVTDKPKSPGLPSSSPTKADTLVPPEQQLPPPGPGLSAPRPGRRGHAHRRSAAISSMDLTAIAKAYPSKPVAGSAPATPADMKQQHAWTEENSRPLSRSATSLNATTPPESPEKESASEPQCKIEFVDNTPSVRRPLSTISSETSSSLSTIRANHSATGSLGSSSGQGISNKTIPRPKSANPAFSFNQTTGFGENAQLKRPLSASASTTLATSTNPAVTDSVDMPPKKKHIWGRSDPGVVQDKSEPESSRTTPSTASITQPSSAAANPSSRTQSNRKSGKKQKKVRSWAGAILTRKGKRRSKNVSRRTPTPPPNPPAISSDDDSMSDVDFDEDNTVVLRTPTNPDAPKATLSSLHTNLPNTSLESSWKPRSFYEQGSELDILSPVIDLDAALGPFNTPELRSERPATSSFSAATKRMYSGGRRGEFVGPEMRYHRRAESAPEMPPFDRSSMGRFGSNPAIDNPDVFDEEEEDAFLADNPSEADGKPISTETAQASTDNTETRSSRRDSSATVIARSVEVQNEATDTAGLGIQVVDSADSDGSYASDHSMTTSQEKEQYQHANAPTQRTQESVEILESDGLPSPLGKPPSSTSSPRCKSRFLHVEKRPASSPVDFAYHAQQMPPPLSESSGFPSPDPSNLSFEAPHLTTASSSMTDHNPSNYSSRCRGSVEDVPSLTSSTSTTTNSMPRFSGSFFVRSSGDRSASFSTPRPRRTSQAHASKRSSLASLSKLVVGSHGERSKLSHEEKAPGEECEKSKKKSHRLSRLMHFWKTKEKEKTQAKENLDRNLGV